MTIPPLALAATGKVGGVPLRDPSLFPRDEDDDIVRIAGALGSPNKFGVAFRQKMNFENHPWPLFSRSFS